jgi:hypothetical protein
MIGVMKAWDPLIETLEVGIRVGNQFPVSYNQALITGWLAYAQRALRKMEVGDAELLERCRRVQRQAAKELAIYLEDPQLLRRASLSHFERLANDVEVRVIELGLLPPLMMLRLDEGQP